MKRFALAVCAVLLLSCYSPVFGATEVKMTGDARIHANSWTQHNFTGWNGRATQTQDSFTIWQRFRLRSDFIANESLKFRFAIRANNTPWGNGYTTVDAPAVSIQVYQAFLQFKWPDTDIEFSVGYLDTGLPVSSYIFDANPVFGDSRTAAFIVSIPVAEQFRIVAAYARLLDSNGAFDPTTTQVPDELDAYYAALHITLEGFKASPWGILAVAGRNAAYGTGANSLGANLLSGGSLLAPATPRNAQNLYWWAGSAFSLTALDPFKFYADVIYGEGNGADRGKNRRAGFFFDAAAEYTGFDILTPQLSFWYSTGEDSSTGNGSERLPSVVNYWGPSNSFLFDCTQAFTQGFMGVNSIGSWGFAASLNKMSFLQDLNHRLTFTYARGTNSGRALRVANTLWGNGNYVQMGRDLSTNEYVMAVNFDSQYDIYANLAAIVETGWAHGEFERSIWGRRLVNQAGNGDAFKVAFGLQYKF